MAKSAIRKVVIYITQRDKLLVFRHTEFPENVPELSGRQDDFLEKLESRPQ